MSNSDTTGLPAEFTLRVIHKDGWWKITSPEHPGLYLLHRNLPQILEDVPLSLATLIKMDEEVKNDA
jgi:hypothetical protein